MKTLTVVPAYGRDYTTAKAAKADWQADKDFIIADFFNPWDGKYINRPQATDYAVTIRFNRLTKTVRV
jgi:hypothetical protein